ncbi:MAG: hypothetical protein M0042_14820 [Nitrospiraceae bacterium]|nr:hypothetical protein [Nitrospiraceae bacterium]
MMTDHRPVPAVAAEGFTSVIPADVTAQASDELPIIGFATPDIGTVLYQDEFVVETAGSAAGGVRKTSTDTRNARNVEIWDNLLGQPGGSDLP